MQRVTLLDHAVALCLLVDIISPPAKHAKQAVEAAHAFHTTRSPTEEDKGACAVLAKALADGSDDAEEALEVRDLFGAPYWQEATGLSAN